MITLLRWLAIPLGFFIFVGYIWLGVHINFHPPTFLHICMATLVIGGAFIVVIFIWFLLAFILNGLE